MGINVIDKFSDFNVQEFKSIDFLNKTWDYRINMKATIKKIVEQVEALPESELDEFLSWLAEYETSHSDEWDKEMEQDSQNGGPLGPVLKRVRADIAAGRTKPLDEVKGNHLIVP